jgi:hypothetical protein
MFYYVFSRRFDSTRTCVARLPVLLQAIEEAISEWESDPHCYQVEIESYLGIIIDTIRPGDPRFSNPALDRRRSRKFSPVEESVSWLREGF